MVDHPLRLGRLRNRAPLRASLIRLAGVTALAAVLTPATLAGLSVRTDAPLGEPTMDDRPSPDEEAVAGRNEASIYDPTASLSAQALRLAHKAPVASGLRLADVRTEAAADLVSATGERGSGRSGQSSPAQAPAEPLRNVPLPVPRPPELAAKKANERTEGA